MVNFSLSASDLVFERVLILFVFSNQQWIIAQTSNSKLWFYILHDYSAVAEMRPIYLMYGFFLPEYNCNLVMLIRKDNFGYVNIDMPKLGRNINNQKCIYLFFYGIQVLFVNQTF